MAATASYINGRCGGSIVGCRRRLQTATVAVGDGINNSGQTGEDGGESSKIVDYSVESCRKILCKGSLQNVTTGLYARPMPETTITICEGSRSFRF